MKLYEFQGKRLLREFGIPTPDGQLFTANAPWPTDLVGPKVLKAQVLAGGRGKAGGVKLVRSGPVEPSAVQELLQLTIKGEPVRAVLVESAATIRQEYYLAFTFAGTEAVPLLIACPAGGMDIESVAVSRPQSVLRLAINPLTGPTGYQMRTVAKAFGLDRSAGLADLVRKLWRLFRCCDANLVEINPLALTDDGLLALDAKVALDEKAAYQQAAAFAAMAEEQATLQPPLAEAPAADQHDTITYVPMGGTVGLVSDGAGTGMLTLDLIKDAGGEAANFCELGGLTSPEVMYQALCRVLANPRVRSLLVVLIGGFNRMDDMAAGIIRYQQAHGLHVPLVVRMCGTLEEAGKEMMRAADIPTYDNLLEAETRAVSLTGGER